jgi:gliding motility-associated-like protein
VVEDTNQCKVEKDITVTVNPIPTLEVGENQLICPGATVVLNVSGSGTFVWDSSPYLSCLVCRNPTVTPPDVSDEMYRVEITDANGCKNRDSVAVRTRPFPDITVSLKSSGRCAEENFIFTPEVRYSDLTCPVFGQYTWDFGDGTISHEEKPIHQYTSEGSFPVTVKYAYSNSGRDTIVVLSKDSCIKNVFIPNTFTPNGDGSNDKVFLRTINATKILLRIFNRWGEEVFRTESLHEGWDGTYKGVKQTPQTFVYVAEVTFYDDTRKVLEGNITLVE